MEVARAMRIRRFPVRFLLGRENLLEAFVVRQTFQPFFLAQDINVALREDGAKPSRKFAAAVEMIEERDAADSGFSAVERGVQGVRKFARIGIARRAPGNGRGGGVEILAICGEEVLPSGFASRGTCRSQSKILHMKRGEVILEFLPGG